MATKRKQDEDLLLLVCPCPLCTQGILHCPRGPRFGDSLCRNCALVASGMGTGVVRVVVRRGDVEKALRGEGGG